MKINVWYRILSIGGLSLLSHCETVIGSTPSLSRKESKTNTVTKSPLGIDNEVVIKSISEYLWNHKFPDDSSEPFKFLIKGSYPAAVKALEASNGELVLPFNDIDVFVEAPVKSDATCSHKDPRTRLIKSSYVQGLIPNSDVKVQVSIMCQLDPEFHTVEWADINAVMAGFTVVPKKHQKKLGDPNDAGESVIPQIGDWILSPSFEQFLHKQVLELDYQKIYTHFHGQQAAKSVIRLLHKAEQLGMKYKVPDEQELKDLLHGKIIGAQYKRKFDKLDDSTSDYHAVIKSHYDVIPVEGHSAFYMFVLKGSEIPTRPRKLQDCYYEGAEGCELGGQPGGEPGGDPGGEPGDEPGGEPGGETGDGDGSSSPGFDSMAYQSLVILSTFAAAFFGASWFL